ncbi:hypothetical protein B4U80_13258 [Leptotrombidium deliense]|uniref:Uncharacterized protein n=1 Tax=Leptotrombidium deliense TaxID=299467 RepID=A0A443S9J7_9ACAR|nr:hypothetical protein B4U80_13258 [Leptotrombidium deliense]
MIKRKRLKHDPSVTGAVMVHHRDSWSLGYSFQGEWSVPLYAQTIGNTIETYTIVETNLSETVGTNKPWKDVFQEIGVKNRFIIPNAHWFGCPWDEWCYRGYIDEATTLWNGMLLVFSGKWIRFHRNVREYAVESRKIHEYYNLNIPNYIDIAFTDRDNQFTVIIKEDRLFLLHFTRNSWFLEEEVTNSLCQNDSNGFTAITYGKFNWTNNGELFMFQTVNNYQILVHRAARSTRKGEIFQIREAKSMTELVPQQVFPIEAAFKDPKTDDVYVMNGMFAYKIHGDRFWQKKGIFGYEYSYLLGCYKSSLNNPLGVNLDEYEHLLMNGFHIRTFFLKTTEQSFKEWLSEIVKVSTIYLILAIVVVSVVIIGALAFGIVKYKAKKEKSKSDKSSKSVRRKAKQKEKKASKRAVKKGKHRK